MTKKQSSSIWIASAIIKSFSSIYYNWWLVDNPLITSTKSGCYIWLDNDSKTSYLQHCSRIIISYQKYEPNKEILESKCCWTNYTCICHITARQRECSLLRSPVESNISSSAHTKHSSSCCNFVQKVMPYHSNLERTALASCFTENCF